MKFIILTSIFFISVMLYGQTVPFTSIEMEDSDIADWVLTSRDTSVIDNDNLDGRNHVSPVFAAKSIIKDGFLYSVTPTRIEGNDNEGGLAEKIDLQTGHVIWQYAYDSRNITLRELPVDININKDGNIELVNMKLIEDKPINFPNFLIGSDVTFAIHILESETGMLLDHKYPSDSIRNYSFNSLGDNDFLYYDNFGERYHLFRELRKDTQQYVVIKLDHNLNHTAEKRILDSGLPVIVDDILFGGVKETDNYMVTFDAKIISSINYKRVYSLRYWDEELNLVYNIGDILTDIIEEVDPFQISILDATDEMVLLSVQKSNSYNFAYLVRNDGVLINKLDLTFEDPNSSITNQYKIYKDEIIAIGLISFEDPSQNKLEIIKIGNDSEVLVSSGFIPINQKIFPRNILFEENTLVFQSWQFKDTLFNGVNGNYFQGSTYIKLNQYNLGLVSNTTELMPKNSVILFPNPASDHIDVLSDEPVKCIKIFNSAGILINEHYGLETLDVSNLPNGIYFIKVFLTSGQVENSQVILRK